MNTYKILLSTGFFVLFILSLLYISTLIFDYELDENTLYIIYGILGIIGLILILFGIIFWIKYNKSQKTKEFERLLKDKYDLIIQYEENNMLDQSYKDKLDFIHKLLFNIREDYKKNVQYNNNHQVYMKHLIATIENITIDKLTNIDEITNIEYELEQLLENYIYSKNSLN